MVENAGQIAAWVVVCSPCLNRTVYQSKEFLLKKARMFAPRLCRKELGLMNVLGNEIIDKGFV